MNFFLGDVWKQSKIVFAFFVVFILGTVWCTFSKIEITPFFLWAHYSDQQTPTGKFERIYVKVNGEILDLPELSRPTREMIQLPTEYCIQLIRNEYDNNTRQAIRGNLSKYFSAETTTQLEDRLCNSDKDEYAFLIWLGTYIESVTREPWKTIEIGTCDLIFQEDRSVRVEHEMPQMSVSRP